MGSLVTDENIDDALEIFMWGTERNMPVCITPTMVSGMGHCIVDETKKQVFQELLQ